MTERKGASMTTRETLLAEAAGIMRALDIDSTGKNFGLVLDEYNKTIMAANVAESIAAQAAAAGASMTEPVAPVRYVSRLDLKDSPVGLTNPIRVKTVAELEGHSLDESPEKVAAFRKLIDKHPAPAPASLRDMTEADFDKAHGIAPAEHTAADAPNREAGSSTNAESSAAGVPDVAPTFQDFRDWAWKKEGTAIGHMDGQSAAREAWMACSKKSATALAALQSQNDALQGTFESYNTIVSEHAQTIQQQAERIKELEAAVAVRDDMTDVGEALMSTLKGNMPTYSWLNCPTEVVTDLLNDKADITAKLAEAVGLLEDAVSNYKPDTSRGISWRMKRSAFLNKAREVMG